MRCSKLRYYSDLELASTSKKIDKDEFFEVPLYKFPCHNQRVVLIARFCNEQARPVGHVFYYDFIMRCVTSKIPSFDSIYPES